MNRHAHRQGLGLRVRRGAARGFAIASAVFLLVILAALGVAMITFSTSQQASSGYDVLGARAYQAAKAGIEWALFQRLNPAVSNSKPIAYCAADGVNPPDNLNMPANTTLTPFTVTVACTSTTTTFNTNATTGLPSRLTIRNIVSTACNQPVAGKCPGSVGPDYIQRVVEISIQENPDTENPDQP
jgi:MSHA biogenesis protein MshP